MEPKSVPNGILVPKWSENRGVEIPGSTKVTKTHPNALQNDQKSIYFCRNLGGAFMPSPPPHTKNEHRSDCISVFLGIGFAGRVPAVHACFYYKISKKNGQRSACISMIFGNDFAGRVPAHSKLCIYFYLFLERLSHCCAEILAGLPAGIAQLTGRWQKRKVLCPAAPAPKGMVAVSDRRSFRYIYIYI